MPYYDIPSYAEYEGCEYEIEGSSEYEWVNFGAQTWVACVIPEDKPVASQAEVTDDEDFPF